MGGILKQTLKSLRAWATAYTWVSSSEPAPCWQPCLQNEVTLRVLSGLRLSVMWRVGGRGVGLRRGPISITIRTKGQEESAGVMPGLSLEF